MWGSGGTGAEFLHKKIYRVEVNCVYHQRILLVDGERKVSVQSKHVFAAFSPSRVLRVPRDPERRRSRRRQIITRREITEEMCTHRY